MWIVAVGWIYVVALMAATEPTVVAGIMTFFGYCVLPLSIVFYIAGSKGRRARGEMAARADRQADEAPAPGATDDTSSRDAPSADAPSAGAHALGTDDET